MVNPDFSKTASIDSRNSLVSLTPVVKESWFEQLLEFVAGRFILTITLWHHIFPLNNDIEILKFSLFQMSIKEIFTD